MNNTKTAILLIEFQKTWTERGVFHRLIKKEYESRNVLKNTKNLLAYARKNGYQVIQAPLILDKEDSERYKKTPFPARLLKMFTKDTWKAEFTDGVFNSTDIVVTGRCGFDACEGSNLEQVLRDNNIEALCICGFTTDHCVKETMISLLDKGFDCFLVADCTAAKNNAIQQKVEKEFAGKVINSQRIMKSG